MLDLSTPYATESVLARVVLGKVFDSLRLVQLAQSHTVLRYSVADICISMVTWTNCIVILLEGFAVVVLALFHHALAVAHVAERMQKPPSTS